MNIRPTDVAIFVALGVAGWILHKMLDQLTSAGDAAGDAIGDLIAPIVVGPAQSVAGGVVLPDGRSVTFDAIVAAGGSLKALPGDVYTFSWQGINYRVVPPRRADGRYNAVRV